MTVMLLQHSPLQHYKLSSATAPASPPNKTAASAPSPPSPQHQQVSLHYHQQPSRMTCSTKAMRYYRLWIYTCNAVLLLSVLGFAIVAGRIVVADPRRYLVPGLSLYQPSFLYAYLALATQSGLLQVVGCLGALRLNERLLNVYWLLLLVLLFGDAIVGIVWVFRFDKICADLRPTLKQRLAAEYGVDADFTTLWDALQRDYKCCGIDGVQDFGGVVNRTNGAPSPTTTTSNSDWMWPEASAQQITHQGIVPESCCKFLLSTDSDSSIEKRPLIHSALKSFQNLVSPSSSISSSAENESLSHVLSSQSDLNRVPTDTSTSKASSTTTSTSSTLSPEPCGASSTVTESRYHSIGCEDSLLLWLRQSADVLFVLGYCVIAFLKLCFLGILRYEIREMIQKIKILQGEMRPPQLLLTELGGATSPINSPTANTTTPHLQPLLMNHHENSNGNLVTGTNGGMIPVVNATSPSPCGGGGGGGVGGHGGASTAGNRGRTDSGNALLLLQPPDSLQTTPMHVSAAAQRHLNLLNDGTDSDTNSNCALIITEESSKPRTKQTRGSNGNNNYEIHELQELNRLLSRHQTQI